MRSHSECMINVCCCISMLSSTANRDFPCCNAISYSPMLSFTRLLTFAATAAILHDLIEVEFR
jgi:hypothetical protein